MTLIERLKEVNWLADSGFNYTVFRIKEADGDYYPHSRHRNKRRNARRIYLKSKSN